MFDAVFVAFRKLFPGGEVPTDERRDIVRVPCRIPAFCVCGDQRQQVTVVDMGLKGMRLEAPSAIGKGKQVTLERPKDGGPVTCKVVWCQPKRASDKQLLGLQFTDSADNMRRSWIRGALQKLGFVPGRIKERRKHIRVPAEHRAVLANKAGDILSEGNLKNLGLSGALVLTHIQVPKGMSVRLQVDPLGTLPLLDAVSEVRSCSAAKNDNKFYHGLKFEDVDEELVKKYLRMLMKSRR